MADQALRGKVVVIGGASKNLGSLICKTLGAEGASVVVHYNSASSKAPAEETVEAVKTAGGDAFAFQADMRKVPEVVKLFDEARSATAASISPSILPKRYSKNRSSTPRRKNMTKCLPSTQRRRISSCARRRSG